MTLDNDWVNWSVDWSMSAALLETTVGAYEAKANFSALLARVANGETIIVTRRGRDVAKIVPADPRGGVDWEAFEALRNQIAARNKGKPPLDFKALINRGRKY